MENAPVCPDTIDDYNILINEIKLIDDRTNVISRLSAISVAIKYANEKYDKRKGYYLLQLNFDKKILKVNKFSTNQIELATTVYDKIESLNNPQMDAVLVAATSFDALKVAYPNYFSDITDFVYMLRRILT